MTFGLGVGATVGLAVGTGVAVGLIVAVGVGAALGLGLALGTAVGFGLAEATPGLTEGLGLTAMGVGVGAAAPPCSSGDVARNRIISSRIAATIAIRIIKVLLLICSPCLTQSGASGLSCSYLWLKYCSAARL